MRTDGMHAVVKAVTAPAGLTFNVIKRCGMDHGTSGPRSSAGVRHGCDDLRGRRRIRAKQASGFRTWRALGGVLSRDYPGSRVGVLAEFHGTEDHPAQPPLHSHFHPPPVSPPPNNPAP